MALPGAQGDRLTDLGWEQAREAGKHLGDLGATRILTSPLRRARETAEALAESLELPIEVLEPLHELRESDGFGELGLEQQRLRRWSAWMTEHADDPEHSYEGGESFNDVIAPGRGRQGGLRSARRRARPRRQPRHLPALLPDALACSAGEFRPSQAQRLWQIGSVNCGLRTFEHGDSVLETGYAAEPWRLVTWMARPWDPA